MSTNRNTGNKCAKILTAMTTVLAETKQDDLEPVEGDIVYILDQFSIGVVRTFNSGKHGIEVLYSTVEEKTHSEPTNHAYLDSLTFADRRQLQKITNVTLLQLINNLMNENNLCIKNLKGIELVDNEAYDRDITVNDVVLIGNESLCIVFHVDVMDGSKMYQVNDAATMNRFVNRSEIRRIYTSEELLDVAVDLILQPNELVSLKRNLSIAMCDTVHAMNFSSQLIVVCPSCSYDSEMAESHPGVHMSETRFLPYLLYTKKPNVKVIFLSSVLVNSKVLDYYLSIGLGDELQDDPQEETLSTRHELMSRVRFFGLNDFSEIPLTNKILSRPRSIERLNKMIDEFGADCEEKYLLAWCKTSSEELLAQKLGLSLYGPTAQGEFYGSKAGSRQAFRDTRVPHARGTYVPIFDPKDVAGEIIRLLCRMQEIQRKRTVHSDELDLDLIPNRVGLKINDGFGGGGNAVLMIHDIIRNFLLNDEKTCTLEEWIEMELKSGEKIIHGTPEMTWDVFSRWINKLGVIVEEWFDNVVASPACLGFIHRKWAQIVSIHDQVLVDERFEGMAFPSQCDDKTIELIREYGARIGNLVRQRGGLETFSVDWVICEDPNTHEVVSVNAVEINLRWGGSSVPPRLVKFATGGTYDVEKNQIILDNGESRCFQSFDGMVCDEYKSLLPEDIIDLLNEKQDIKFDHDAKTGVIAHLLDTLPMFGKFGFVAVGKTPEHCRMLIDKAKVRVSEIL